MNIRTMLADALDAHGETAQATALRDENAVVSAPVAAAIDALERLLGLAAPERTTARLAAYEAIDSERVYQDLQLGNAKRHPGQPAMTTGEHILAMQKCLHDARMIWYRPDGGAACIDDLRKVAALAVACMELYGAPLRHLPPGATPPDLPPVR